MKIRLADYVADFLVAHGPVWIDIPVDFQGCYIDTDSLAGYDSTEDESSLCRPRRQHGSQRAAQSA